MTIAEMGSATTRGSTYWISPSNRTCLPVMVLHTARNTDMLLLMKSAQNRYTTEPAVMLAAAAFLLGLLEYSACTYAGSRAAAVIPMNRDVALAMISEGMR